MFEKKFPDPIIYPSDAYNIYFMQKYRKQILSVIEKFFQEKISASKNPDLWQKDIARRLWNLTRRGKTLRGCLLLFSIEMFGGKININHIKLAGALELFETSVLIHDDLIDQDKKRRGISAMHVQYAELGKTKKVNNSKSYGENLALVTGDIGYFWIYEILSETKFNPDHLNQVISYMSGSFSAVCLGQIMDTDLSSTNTDVKKADILKTYYYKTAGYTFILPLVLGAIVRNQSTLIRGQLEKLGYNLGLIYQIKDDQLGIFGKSNITGKKAGSDISANKKTLYYYYLSQRSSGSEWSKLKNIFGKSKLTDNDIEKIKNSINTTKTDSQIRKDLDDLVYRSQNIINQLKVKQHYRKTLSDLLTYLNIRAK